MSGIVDKLKSFIGIDDEYYYEEDEYLDDDYLDDNPPSKSKKINNKVVNIHTNANMKIVVHQPLTYEEAPGIVEDLKIRKVVVINFEQLDSGLKRQVFDFINGAIYALEGKITKVTKDIFILAQNNVEIDGLRDELNHRSLFPW